MRTWRRGDEPGRTGPEYARLDALARLLLQLRVVLVVLTLPLLPAAAVDTWLVLAICGYATLTALVAWRWERFAPRVRKHPVLITADVFCATSVLVIAGPSGVFFVATVLTSAVAGLLFTTTGAFLVAALQMLGYLGALADPATGGRLDVQVLVIHPLLYPVAGYIGVRARGVFAELATEQTARRAAERARASAEERSRLARELHDSVAKTLRGLAMSARSLPQWVDRDPARAAAVARQIAAATDTAAQEARELISGLREPEPAAGTDEDDLAGAVSRHVSEWGERAGVAVRLHVPDTRVTVAVPVHREALAILGEGLSNVEQHARASTVTLSLAAAPSREPPAAGPAERDTAAGGGSVVLRLADDGRGFDPDHPPAGHFGLRGMRERASAVGGTLRVRSASGAGSTLTVELPTHVAGTPPNLEPDNDQSSAEPGEPTDRSATDRG